MSALKVVRIRGGYAVKRGTAWVAKFRGHTDNNKVNALAFLKLLTDGHRPEREQAAELAVSMCGTYVSGLLRGTFTPGLLTATVSDMATKVMEQVRKTMDLDDGL